ncbi:MAG: type II secretion system F family protein [Bacilli bacterium]
MEPIIWELNIVELFLIFVFLFIIIRLIKQIKVAKLNKRIDKYSFKKVISEKDISLGDYFYNAYRGIIRGITLILSKSKRIKKNANKKYKKFIKDEKLNILPVDIISIKTLSAIVLFIFYIILLNLTKKNITDFPLLIILIIGYYLPNIYYFYDYKKRIKSIEKDILNTITILNNAYKAGKSTLQAVEIIAGQESPIGREFNLLYNDLIMGIEFETAFNRLAKRTKIEEFSYIATTISISEKTGGNIIKVFSAIEKNLYNRYKINHEMKTLTANSKITIKVLIIMPIVFILGVHLLSPDFFLPLFNTTIGNMVIVIITALLILYVFFINKILKVRV